MTQRHPTAWVPLVLAVVIFALFQFAPFVNQPERGATTIPVLTESRDANELDVETSGLILIPVAAAVLLMLGVWNFVSPEINRVSSAFAAVVGVLMLEYFIVFAINDATLDTSTVGQMGIGFWGLLVCAVLLIVQVVLPRPKVNRDFSLRRFLSNQESAIVVALVVLLLVVGIGNPRFLATRNILDVLQGNAYIAVAAIGMSMVIITGNIDISVGALIGLLAVVSGRIVTAGMPVYVAWVAPLFIGAAIGAVIGWLVAYAKVPSIVVSLGMLSILKGFVIIWTNGERVTDMPPDFYLAQMRPLDIPMPIWFMVVLTILAALWMRYSGTGRALYAVGGNAEAARLSGISQQRIVMTVFIINCVFVGIASVLYATQLSVIQATPPANLELFIITSAVVGGVSILGGKGLVIGSTLAAILLSAIRSGMVFINVSPFWIQAVQGLLILGTVLIDLIRRRRQIL
jgi:ribose/xylose/arabinose/galactoside ABC-type transport system permease subunit